MACACSEGLSWATSAPLFIPSLTHVTFRCPELTPMNLHSSSGECVVDEDATLTFVGCSVQSVATRSVAATGPVIPGFGDGYFGSSPGTVRFQNSRLLLPAEVRVLSCERLNRSVPQPPAYMCVPHTRASFRTHHTNHIKASINIPAYLCRTCM